LSYDSSVAFDRDSILKTFPEINIEAKRNIFGREKKFSSYSELNRATIEKENPRQISEMISNEPGVFIKDYGGLGGIKTISLRGTSSQQTLVLIEGMKFNSTQNNSVDFSIFPVSMINSVDILKGGSSAIFGGSSIGGTINMNLTEPIQQLKAAIGIGSFDEYSGSLSATNFFGDIPLSIAFDAIHSKGDFPFSTQQFGETKNYTRENAEFMNYNLMANTVISSGNWLYKVIAMARYSKRGSPGPVLLGYVKPNDAELMEKDADLIFKADRKSGNGFLSSGLLIRLNRQDYWDSQSVQALQGDTNSSFDSRNIQLNTEYQQTYNLFETIVGIEAEYSDLKGDFLQPGAGSSVDRFSGGIFARAITNLIDAEDIILPLQLGARYDAYSDVAGSPSGILGLSLFLDDAGLEFKSQTAYNYRPPSFNEMYYLNYGTKDLKPEKSLSFNLAVVYTASIFKTEINCFFIDTQDQIVAVPKSPLTWSASNMASVLSRGAEIIFGAETIADVFNINISYTLQSVIDNNESSDTYKKQIVYVPQEMFGTNAGLNILGFYFGANLNYVGFTFALPDNSYYSLIPEYWLLNVKLSRSFPLGSSLLTLKVDALNILDEQYAVVKNYPMPGRVFRLSLSYELI